MLRLIRKPDGILEILLFIRRKKKATVSELMKSLKLSQEACYSAIGKLTNLGLVYSKREKGWPTFVYYRLTLKGSEMTQYLVSIEDMLRDTYEGFKSELSTLEELKKTRKNVEKRMELLNRLQDFAFTIGKLDATINYSEKLLELSQEQKEKKNMAQVYRLRGNVQRVRNDYEGALENLQQSLELFSEIEDQEGIADNHYSLGSIFDRTGKYENALQHHNECVNIAGKICKDDLLAKGLLGLGRIYAHQGKYNDSIKYFKRAIRALNKDKDMDELPKVYTNLGSSYFYVNLDEAINWHKRCIETSEKTGDIRMLGYGLSNIARCLIEKSNAKEGLEYLNKALRIFENIGEVMMIASIYCHYGTIYKMQKEWDSSTDYFRKSIEILNELNVPHKLGGAYFQFGLMYKDKGENDNAKSQLTKALGIFKNLDAKEIVKEIKKELKVVKIK